MVQLIAKNQQTTTAPDGRGSGRRSLRVWVGGYEPIYSQETGEYLGDEFVTETHRIEIEDSFMGLQDNIQIEAWQRCNAPDKTILDWQFCRPSREF